LIRKNLLEDDQPDTDTLRDWNRKTGKRT